MDTDTPLNPYCLLGVSVASTCQEVRKAYFELAMHAHPDKGGSADQMRVVQAAYEYVVRQIAAIDRSKPMTELYENAENEFKRFCEDQVAAKPPPCFSDIFAEAHGMPTFNQLWEEAHAQNLGEDLDPAAHRGGYGHLMAAASEQLDTYEPCVDETPVDVPKTVALYVEPEALVKPSDLYRDLTVHCTHPVADYSAPGGLNDYQAAFAPVLPADMPVRPDADLTDELLNALIEARAAL